MILVAIVPFLDEEEHLPVLLATIERQERRPDALMLVDDGSSDRSPAIAAAFAERHPFATVLHRERRPPERDRMVQAPELKAFTWALDQVPRWDVACELDADLALSPDLFAEIERQFEADAALGMAGAYLAALDDEGRARRQRCPAAHVEGENTFYRRACLEQIAPLPAILGWDTIDEVRARMHGWRTASFAMPSGDPVHLRRMAPTTACCAASGARCRRTRTARTPRTCCSPARRGWPIARACSAARTTSPAGRSPRCAGSRAPSRSCGASSRTRTWAGSAACCASPASVAAGARSREVREVAAHVLVLAGGA